jgi:hypothetical protein
MSFPLIEGGALFACWHMANSIPHIPVILNIVFFILIAFRFKEIPGLF